MRPRASSRPARTWKLFGLPERVVQVAGPRKRTLAVVDVGCVHVLGVNVVLEDTARHCLVGEIPGIESEIRPLTELVSGTMVASLLDQMTVNGAATLGPGPAV